MSSSHAVAIPVFLLCHLAGACGALAAPSLASEEGGRGDLRLVADLEDLADTVAGGELFAVVGGTAFFWVEEYETRGGVDDVTMELSLWRTDGTPDGTYCLLPSDLALLYHTDSLGDVLFFAACRSPHPRRYVGPACSGRVELWRTDGTREGTFRLLEGEEHLRSFGPFVTRALPELGKLFFVTQGPDVSERLWSTDGTRSGTEVVTDLGTVDLGGSKWFRRFGGKVYFLADNVAQGSGHVWVGRSDGTPEGTEVFPSGLEDRHHVESFSPADGRIFLVVRAWESEGHPGSGHDVQRRSLWVLEEGDERFRHVADLGFKGFFPVPHVESGGGRVFLQFNPFASEEFEVWASDGTGAGTHRLGTVDQHMDALWSEPLQLPGGEALVILTTEEHGVEPWRTDGTPEGTELLADFCPGACSSHPESSATFGGWFHFTASGGPRGRELWRWRPGTDRLELAYDLCPGPCSSSPRLMDETEGVYFYVARGPESRLHVWAVRPDAPPQRVADFRDLRFGSPGSLFSDPIHAWRVVGDHAVFWAQDPEDRLGLWSMAAPSTDPPPPEGPWLTTDAVPGFAIKVRITGGDEPILGRAEPACIPETLCVSGALPGRSEVFARIVGPKPNGKLWPTLVKFTTSTVEVWIEQLASGVVRYYRLEGATPGSSELPGLFDREGFSPE